MTLGQWQHSNLRQIIKHYLHKFRHCIYWSESSKYLNASVRASCWGFLSISFFQPTPGNPKTAYIVPILHKSIYYDKKTLVYLNPFVWYARRILSTVELAWGEWTKERNIKKVKIKTYFDITAHLWQNILMTVEKQINKNNSITNIENNNKL